MDKIIRDRMEGLVNERAIFDLCTATKVLYSDLAFGFDEFELDDIRAFLTTKVFSAVVEAAEQGPPKPEDYPKLASAISFVKRYVEDSGYERKYAEKYAIGLYDLSDMGVRMLKHELDEVGL